MAASPMNYLSRLLTVCLFLFGMNEVSVGEMLRPPTPELPQKLSRFEGLQNPLTGERLTTLDPLERQSAQDKRKSAALAHYMSGRIASERRRIATAVTEFKTAIQLDPESLAAYEAIIPILLRQSNLEGAADYSLRAAQNTNDGYELVLVMASVYVRQTRVDQGINLMESSLGTRSVPVGSKEELLVHRDLGLYHRLNNDIEKSAAEYQLVFDRLTRGELDSTLLGEVLKDPGANFDEFGDTFLKAGKPELALKSYEEASKHRQAKPGLHSFNLATVFQQTGKPELALKSLQEYFDAQLQSRGRAPYVLLEELLKDLKLEGELLTRLEALLEKDKANEVLRYFLADKILANGEFNKAKELYLHGQDSVTDPRALVGMIAIYRQSGESAQLLDALTKAFQVIPRGEDEESLKRLAEDLRVLSENFEAELKNLKSDDTSLTSLFDHARKLKAKDESSLEFIPAYLLGKLAVEADYTDAAYEFYRHAIGMRNEPPALLYTEIGGHLLDAEHYEDAITILNEALSNPSNSLQSDRWRFLFFLSYGYEFQGETAKALEIVQEAMNVAPDPIIGRLEYQKAWIYYHARDWDKALAQFEDVIETFASNQDLVQDSQFRVSSIYVELGEMLKGEKVLEDVLKEDPENTQANNDLGYLWADQGKNLEQAESMIHKALTAEPENPAYLDSMGWVLYMRGDYAGAVKHLRQATETKNGDDSTIFEHLADALDKLGKSAEALANYKKALDLEQKKKNPSEKLLKSVNAKLKQAAAN